METQELEKSISRLIIDNQSKLRKIESEKKNLEYLKAETSKIDKENSSKKVELNGNWYSINMLKQTKSGKVKELERLNQEHEEIKDKKRFANKESWESAQRNEKSHIFKQANKKAVEEGQKKRQNYEELFKSHPPISENPKLAPESPKSPSRSGRTFKLSHDQILNDREIRKLECENSELGQNNDQLNYELKRLKEENLRCKSAALPAPVPQHQLFLVLIIGFLVAVLAHISFKL